MKRSIWQPPDGGIKAIRRAIMVVVKVVSLGYLLLWIMAPTNVYKHTWLPKIRAHTNSTFFGIQGVNILLYTFPILFIAALGCVYLHLGMGYGSSSIQSINSNGRKHKQLGVWKRAVIIIKGLGIEMAFFVMFIALLVWSFSTYLSISFAKINPREAAKRGESVWEEKLKSAGLNLGLVGNICLAFLFFPVTRSSSLLRLVGLSFEGSVEYHKWLGRIAMTLFTAHGACYFVYWVFTHQTSEMLKWARTGVSNMAGELTLISGLIMWVTTFPSIRRKKFELFFYTHYLYIIFVIFFIFHVGTSFSFIMLSGFYLFLVDRFLRFLQSRQGVRLVSARILPCQAVELNFSRTQELSYTPTSTMFINVPSISNLQWHPFTVCSSSLLEHENLSVIIKAEGSWSKKLYQMVSSSPSSLHHLDVSIEGPYGAAAIDFLRHDTLVMVSGGSGITPFISIIRELVFVSETITSKSTTPRIHLISAFKNSSDLTMLDLLLPNSSPPKFSNLDIKIEAYVTREREEPSTPPDSSMVVRTIWFNPKPSNEPISPILGANGWLWLGVIISSSFIIFLLLMGVLTRYYIYPIDHNTNKIYPYSSRASLNMLLICLSIASTATAAFYRNKKIFIREKNQIQNIKGASSSPAASPIAERELESYPQQSLVQSTKVYYGERPDLKRILFEHKESSIGVLVCGPKKMRHEVARMCTSRLADNLHFESISFSW